MDQDISDSNVSEYLKENARNQLNLHVVKNHETINYENELHKLNSKLLLIDNQKNKISSLMAYIKLGIEFINYNDIHKAAKAFEKGLFIAEKFEKFNVIGYSLIKLANIRLLQENMNGAIEHYYRYLNIREKLDNPLSKLEIYGQLAQIYTCLGDNDLAKQYSELYQIENDKDLMDFCNSQEKIMDSMGLDNISNFIPEAFEDLFPESIDLLFSPSSDIDNVAITSEIYNNTSELPSYPSQVDNNKDQNDNSVGKTDHLINSNSQSDHLDKLLESTPSPVSKCFDLDPSDLGEIIEILDANALKTVTKSEFEQIVNPTGLLDDKYMGVYYDILNSITDNDMDVYLGKTVPSSIDLDELQLHNSIDMPVIQENRISSVNTNTNMIKTNQYIEQKLIQLKVQRDFGVYLRELKRYDEAIPQFKELLLSSRELNNRSFEIMALYFLQDIYIRTANEIKETHAGEITDDGNLVLQEVAKYYQERIDLAVKESDGSLTREEIMDKYAEKYIYHDALLVQNLLLDRAIEVESKILELKAHMNIAEIYLFLRQPANSIESYRRALRVTYELRKKILRGQIIYRLYQIFRSTNQFKYALKFLQECSYIFNYKNYNENRLQLYNELIGLCKITRNYKLALNYANKMYSVAKLMGNPEALRKSENEIEKLFYKKISHDIVDKPSIPDQNEILPNISFDFPFEINEITECNTQLCVSVPVVSNVAANDSNPVDNIRNRISLAENYHKIGRTDKALVILNFASRRAQLLKNLQYQIEICLRIISILLRMNKLSTALKIQNECFDLIEKEGDQNDKANAYHNLTILYKLNGKYDDALVWAGYHYIVSREMNDLMQINAAKDNIILLRRKLNKQELCEEGIAFHYYNGLPVNSTPRVSSDANKSNQNESTSTILTEDLHMKTKNDHTRGIYMYSNGNYLKAIERYKRNLKNFREGLCNDIDLQADTLMLLGICCYKLCRYGEAIQMFEQLLDLSHEINDINLIIISLYHLQEIHWTMFNEIMKHNCGTCSSEAKHELMQASKYCLERINYSLETSQTENIPEIEILELYDKLFKTNDLIIIENKILKNAVDADCKLLRLITHIKLGKLYIFKKLFVMAIKEYNFAYDIAKSLKRYKTLAEILYKFYQIYHEQNNNKKQVIYLLKLEDICVKNDYLYAKYNVYKTLVKLYSSDKKYGSKIKYMRKLGVVKKQIQKLGGFTNVRKNIREPNIFYGDPIKSPNRCEYSLRQSCQKEHAYSKRVDDHQLAEQSHPNPIDMPSCSGLQQLNDTDSLSSD